MKLWTWLATLTLMVMLAVQQAGASSWFSSCRVGHGSQGNLNVLQPSGVYAYTFVINANYQGRWSVLVDHFDDKGNNSKMLYTDPASDFRGKVEVSPNLFIQAGRWKTLYVSYKDGYCTSYPLGALYPDK